jgi:hypothetical protein
VGLCNGQSISDLAVRPGRAAQPSEYFEVAAYLFHQPSLDARPAREFVVIQSRGLSQGFDHTLGVRGHQARPSRPCEPDGRGRKRRTPWNGTILEIGEHVPRCHATMAAFTFVAFCRRGTRAVPPFFLIARNPVAPILSP